MGRELLVEGEAVKVEICQNATQRHWGLFSIDRGPERSFGALIGRLRDAHG